MLDLRWVHHKMVCSVYLPVICCNNVIPFPQSDSYHAGVNSSVLLPVVSIDISKI